MEQLIKQSRSLPVSARFSGQDNIEDLSSTRERRISLQKTSSFKRGKIRAQKWFQRQFSRQMSQGYDSNEIDHVAAVAAAAFAISSLTESSLPVPKPNKITEATEPLLVQMTSKQDVPIAQEETHRASKQIPGERSRKGPKRQESKVAESALTDKKTPQVVAIPPPPILKTPTIADKPAPSMKKTLTFADDEQHLNGKDILKTQDIEPIDDQTTIKPEIEVPKLDPSASTKRVVPPIETKSPSSRRPEIELAKPDPQTTTAPRISPAETKSQSSTRSRPGETKADAWERKELLKVKKRFEELDARIQSWESKKKFKARHRLDRTERELERRRLKALEQYKKEMEDINMIAGGARAKAAEGQRNDELKVKAKANKIRKTGKIPKTCFCF